MSMRKTAHPLGGVGSSIPHHWRGERLHHHGDDVCYVICAFCVFLTCDLSVRHVLPTF